MDSKLVPIVILPACPPYDAVLLIRLVHDAAPLGVEAVGANLIPVFPFSWCGLERNPPCP